MGGSGFIVVSCRGSEVLQQYVRNTWRGYSKNRWGMAVEIMIIDESRNGYLKRAL